MVGNNNRLQDILDYRNLANTDPMKLMQLRNEAEMPVVNRAIGSQVGDGDQDRVPVGSVHEMLFTPSPELGNDSLASLAIKPYVKEEVEKTKEEEQVASLQNVTTGLNMMAAPVLAYARDNPEKAMQSGGLMGIAAGDDPMPIEQPMPIQRSAMGGPVGGFAGKVPGQGHGMEDNVYMPIVERQAGNQVATLAVSPDEYVVDAHTMSALGNGSADAGAKVMDNVVNNVREQAYGTDKQPNEINGLAALRPMIERV